MIASSSEHKNRPRPKDPDLFCFHAIFILSALPYTYETLSMPHRSAHVGRHGILSALRGVSVGDYVFLRFL